MLRLGSFKPETQYTCLLCLPNPQVCQYKETLLSKNAAKEKYYVNFSISITTC